MGNFSHYLHRTGRDDLVCVDSFHPLVHICVGLMLRNNTPKAPTLLALIAGEGMNGNCTELFHVTDHDSFGISGFLSLLTIQIYRN